MRRTAIALFVSVLPFFLSSCASPPKTVTVTKVVKISPPEAPVDTAISSQPPAEASGIPQIGQFNLRGPSQGPIIDPLRRPQDTGGLTLEPLIIEEIEEPEEEEITYDVPIIQNATVEGYIDYFQNAIKDRFELWLARSGRYIPMMKEIFKSYGLPEDLVFVALIESGFNPIAYSRAKAVGPWQFIRGTGLKYGLRINEWIDERRDPIKSTHSAARYLRDLYAMFDSWPLALASYNAGEGRVMRAIKRTRSDDFWDLRTTHHLRRETKDYVPKFMAATIIAKNPQKYGFNPELWAPLQYDEVTIDSPTDLRVIAKAAGVTYQQIKELNPELRSTVTPFNYRNYVLKLPHGTKETYLANIISTPVEKRIIQLRHRVRWGETLSVLANRYGTSVHAIRALNNLGGSNTIIAGDYLLIPMSSQATTGWDSKNPDPEPDYSLPRPAPGTKKFLYQVRRGDTLTHLARRYGTSVEAIRATNRLRASDVIQAGQHLTIPLDSDITGPTQDHGPVPDTRLTPPDQKAGSNILYQVKRGDTLFSIASRHGTTITALRDLNNLGRSHIIRAGQFLLIPSGSEGFAGDEMIQLRHRVRRGETLSALARKYGTTVKAIRDHNNLGRSHIIRAGTYLLIPSSKQAAFGHGKVKYAESINFQTSKEKKELKRIHYRVRRGDTLWEISRNFNVSISQIRKWNGLHPRSTLRAGKRLVLYIDAHET